jgi:hypothetical protein
VQFHNRVLVIESGPRLSITPGLTHNTKATPREGKVILAGAFGRQAKGDIASSRFSLFLKQQPDGA